jgi:hypothetical protein
MDHPNPDLQLLHRICQLPDRFISFARFPTWSKQPINTHCTMLRTHRFAQSDVQFLALLLTDGDNTMVRTYALAVAIALAGVFGLIESASAKHQRQAAHLLLGNKLQTDRKHEHIIEHIARIRPRSAA